MCRGSNTRASDGSRALRLPPSARGALRAVDSSVRRDGAFEREAQRPKAPRGRRGNKAWNERHSNVYPCLAPYTSRLHATRCHADERSSAVTRANRPTSPKPHRVPLDAAYSRFFKRAAGYRRDGPELRQSKSAVGEPLSTHPAEDRGPATPQHIRLQVHPRPLASTADFSGSAASAPAPY
jgi:hypothetical protein